MENLSVPDIANVSDQNAIGHFCDVWLHLRDHRPNRHATLPAEQLNEVDGPIEPRFGAKCG